MVSDRAANPSPSFLDAFHITPGSVVSIVGSGGKATLMYHFAREGVSQGHTILSTSSTHLHPPNSSQSNHLVVLDETPSWPDRLPALLVAHRHITVVGARPRPDKMRGLNLDQLDRVRGVCPADLMVIKADGARTRPFKAPGDHEPVVPVWTTHCIIVVGLHSIGLPLSKRHVHRPERVAAWSGLRPDAPITPETVAQVVSHPEAYLKAFPETARVFLYMAWCSGEERRRFAEAICRATDAGAAPNVLCGNIEQDRSDIFLLR